MVIFYSSFLVCLPEGILPNTINQWIIMTHCGNPCRPAEWIVPGRMEELSVVLEMEMITACE